MPYVPCARIALLASVAQLSLACGSSGTSMPMPKMDAASTTADSAPTSPPDATAGQDAGNQITPPIGTPAGSTKTIGAAGGEITGAGATLTVPAGALTADVAFSINPATTGLPAVPTDQGPVSGAVEILPHGQVFTKPATLSLSHAGGTVESIVLLTATATGTWMTLPGTTVELTKVTAGLNHLSYFVVARTIKMNARWQEAYRKWSCVAKNRPDISFEVQKRTPFGADADWVDLTTQKKLPATVGETSLSCKDEGGKPLMNFSYTPAPGTPGPITGLMEFAATAAGRLAYSCTGL